MTKLDFSEWVDETCDEFYANIAKTEDLQFYAQMAGLDDGCDVKLISGYLINTKNLLDIGSGFGRVIDFVLDCGYTGKIISIELIDEYCKLLKRKFGDQIFLINENIIKFETNEKFDTILWLWDGLTAFSKDMQDMLIKKLINILAEKGYLIFDTIDQYKNKIPFRSYVSEHKHGRIVGNIPSYDDIRAISDSLRITNLLVIDYKTRTEVHRKLYILQRIV